LLETLGGRIDASERSQAIELLTWTRLLSGDAFGAQQALAADNGPHSQLLHGAMAIVNGRADEGLSILTWAFVNEPPTSAKLLAAIAVSRAGLTARFAQELLLVGPAGHDSLRVLAELLGYVGLHRDADEAARVAGWHLTASAAGPPVAAEPPAPPATYPGPPRYPSGPPSV